MSNISSTVRRKRGVRNHSGIPADSSVRDSSVRIAKRVVALGVLSCRSSEGRFIRLFFSDQCITMIDDGRGAPVDRCHFHTKSERPLNMNIIRRIQNVTRKLCRIPPPFGEAGGTAVDCGRLQSLCSRYISDGTYTTNSAPPGRDRLMRPPPTTLGPQ
jgi:hypothetical protein